MRIVGVAAQHGVLRAGDGQSSEVVYENVADENATHVWKSTIRPLVLDFVEDGEVLAGASFDGEIRIWNAEDAKGLINFTAAPGYVVPAATAAK